MSNPDSEEANPQQEQESLPHFTPASDFDFRHGELSDDEILRQACFPDDVAREMSANEKKRLADEIRRSAGGGGACC